MLLEFNKGTPPSLFTTHLPYFPRSVRQTLALLMPASLHRLVSPLCEYDMALFSIFFGLGVKMSFEFNFHKRQTPTSHRAVNEQ